MCILGQYTLDRVGWQVCVKHGTHMQLSSRPSALQRATLIKLGIGPGDEATALYYRVDVGITKQLVI